MKQQENNKNIKHQKSKIFELLFVILPALRSLGIGGLFVFLILNLVYSQLISPIYFQIINNNKKATISFLKKIKTFPEFQKILEMNKNIYGKEIETEIFHQENEKKLMINNLEQELLINPRARDVLYSLYLLYREQEDNLTAENYLRRAKVIDPNIN